jgi:hypothetical protein
MMRASGISSVGAGVAIGAYALWLHGDAGELRHGFTTARTAPITDASWSAEVASRSPVFRQLPPLAEPVVVTISRRPRNHPLPHHANLPEDRHLLNRELQKELKRVGCYGGEISGAWTAATRVAAKAFTERANARLPLENPDPILLALVRSYPALVCGRDCPPEQTVRLDGHCRPNGIERHTGKDTGTAMRPTDKPAAATTSWTTSLTAAPTPVGESPEARMALGGIDTAKPNPTPIARPASRPTTPKVAPRIMQGAGNWAHSILMSRASPN